MATMWMDELIAECLAAAIGSERCRANATEKQLLLGRTEGRCGGGTSSAIEREREREGERERERERDGVLL